MYKKILFAILLAGVMITFFVSLVHAVDIQSPISDRFKDIPTIIKTGSGFVQPVAALVLLGVTIYGGFIEQSALDDPEQVKKGRMILRAGFVGFAIVVLAPFIVSIIGAIFGIQLLT